MTQINEEKASWLLPQRQKIHLRPALYLVATPIGNLSDITLRALDVLAAADCVVCEDTRVSGKLLQAYGLRKSLAVYNDHAKESDRKKIMGRIREGQAVAMVSDAGTPLVSDPGYKLVQACIDAEIDVVPVPGASSVLTALQLSGVPSEAFSFIGFLPQKSKARQDVLKRWADVPGALVAFETAPRLLKSLQDILAVLGDRQVAVTRELTKLYEEAKRDNVASLIAHYDSDGLPKGEIVLVIGPQAAGEADEAQVRDMLQALIDDGMRTKEAAAQVALTLEGWSKSDLYALALEMQKGHP